MAQAAIRNAGGEASGLGLWLKKPYLIFLGAVTQVNDCKTGIGLRDWAAEDCAGQLRLPSCVVDLGLADMTPAEARAAGVGSLVIGVAPAGGRFDPAWLPALRAAIDAGLDIVSGLHQRLDEVADLAVLAEQRGVRLHDIRRPTRNFNVGSGVKRSGLRLLTVGLDCAIGKKYAALRITRELQDRGTAATFRATGQTGILIAGGGVAVDAVVADFIAGAAEALSPAAPADHWDIVEGQGSLFHPSFAGVALGLLHGSQPDALVVCHDPTRRHIEDLPHAPLPSLEEAIARNLEAARLTNRAVRCVGVAVNTARLDPDQARRTLDAISHAVDLPAEDPIRTGVKAIANRLQAEF